jgi:hypothetical protein
MSFKKVFILSLLCPALLGSPASAGILEGNCRTADQPAATLLFPYFEVDLDTGGRTTLLSVNNSSSKATLARVVLWTDWGVPTLAFDVYLTGYDIQTVNLRDVFRGTLPVTGAAVSNLGPLSEGGDAFPGCSASGVAPPLGEADRAYLRAAHTGRPVSQAGAATPQCAGSVGQGPAVAVGYATVDVVNRCTPRTLVSAANTPADPTYFVDGGNGLAGNLNVLWGDAFYVDPAGNAARNQTAVHLLADPDVFGPGDYTFYGRYVNFDSRDNRGPLSSLYFARYANGGAFSGGTDLIVWRDNRQSGVLPATCATGPAWASLGELQLFVFDEEENASEIPDSNAFPIATQKVHVGGAKLPTPESFGFLLIDLWHRDQTHAQGWVTVAMTAEGRFSVGYPAVRVDDLCNFGP